MTQAERFDVFWKRYPLKVGKLAAIKAFSRLKVTDELLEQMLTAVDWQRHQESWEKGYIPHPRTWLSQGRWMDEQIESFSETEILSASEVRRKAFGRCPHEPACEQVYDCVKLIAAERRLNRDQGT